MTNDNGEGPPASYKILRQVGEGAFSKVFEVSRPPNLLQCLKVVKQDDGKGIPGDIIREIAMLTHLRSEWVVRLIEVSEDAHKESILLFFERMDTDLHRLCRQQRLSHGQIRVLYRNILLGVDHIHGKGVVHRDLKPSNILIEVSTLVAKIADMGFAYRINLDTGSGEELLAGTLAYLAPEQLCKDIYFSYATDMWSLGCVLAEMALGRPLFNGSTPEQMLGLQTGFLTAFFEPEGQSHRGLGRAEKATIFAEEIELRARLGEPGLDLIKKTMHPQPQKRWRTSGLLSHPFFKQPAPSS
mgnify:CR=1 FL=1